MADFDETYPITEELQEHWHTIRAQRGWSWGTLADYFEKHCSTDPTTPGLIAWARGQEDAPTKARKGLSRAVAEAPESR